MSSVGRATQKYDPVTREWVTPEEYDKRKYERMPKTERGPAIHSWPRAIESVKGEWKKNPRTGRKEWTPRVFNGKREWKAYLRANDLVEGGG